MIWLIFVLILLMMFSMLGYTALMYKKMDIVIERLELLAFIWVRKEVEEEQNNEDIKDAEC